MKAGGLLEEIKSRTDIVDFISDYIPLKKSGQNYKGLCPFHSEKTPSFMVSRTKQIFHCFGCGAGGDIVTFLMKHDNLPFGEALVYIAKKSGIAITESAFDRNESYRRQNILRANEDARQFYMTTLSAAGAAGTYLRQRGLLEETIVRFCIGFAPNQRNALYTYLAKIGHADVIVKNAGLAIADGDSYRDWFRRRIIFPIVSLRGDVVGFGGRVMDNSHPKYINTPETEVFRKSETLFAINLAKDEIRKKGHALIVEGYLDAMACHQHGFRNAVAPLGTALTARHIQKLKSLTGRVLLVFDGDDAGAAAARRSLSICCEQDIMVGVTLLPRGDDPDSFLRKSGREAFSRYLSSSKSMIEFMLPVSGVGRIEAVRETLSMIASVKDLLHADVLVRELADRSKINEAVIRSELEKMRLKDRTRKNDALQSAAPRVRHEELLLLSALLLFPEKAGSVLSRLSLEDITDDTVRSLLNRITGLGDGANIGAILNDADDAEKRLVTGLSLSPGFDPEQVDANIADCLRKLKQRKKEMERQVAEDAGDIKRLDSLLKEKRKQINEANL